MIRDGGVLGGLGACACLCGSTLAKAVLWLTLARTPRVRQSLCSVPCLTLLLTFITTYFTYFALLTVLQGDSCLVAEEDGETAQRLVVSYRQV